MVACGLQIQPITFKGEVKGKKKAAVNVRCHGSGCVCVYVWTCTHVVVRGHGIGQNGSLLDGDGERLWKLLKLRK